MIKFYPVSAGSGYRISLTDAEALVVRSLDLSREDVQSLYTQLTAHQHLWDPPKGKDKKQVPTRAKPPAKKRR